MDNFDKAQKVKLIEYISIGISAMIFFAGVFCFNYYIVQCDYNVVITL